MQRLKHTVDGPHKITDRITQERASECFLIKEARDPKGRLLFYEFVKLMGKHDPEWNNRVKTLI